MVFPFLLSKKWEKKGRKWKSEHWTETNVENLTVMALFWRAIYLLLNKTEDFALQRNCIIC